MASWDEDLYRAAMARRKELGAELEQLDLEIARLDKIRAIPPNDPGLGIGCLPDDILMHMFTRHLADQYQLVAVCKRWRRVATVTVKQRFLARWSISRRYPQYWKPGWHVGCDLQSRGENLHLNRRTIWRGNDLVIHDHTVPFYVCGVQINVGYNHVDGITKNGDVWVQDIHNVFRVNADEAGGCIAIMRTDSVTLIDAHTGATRSSVLVMGPAAVYNGEIYRLDTESLTIITGDKVYTRPKSCPRAVVGAIVVNENCVWQIGKSGVVMYDRKTCRCIQHYRIHNYPHTTSAAFHRGKLFIHGGTERSLHVY